MHTKAFSTLILLLLVSAVSVGTPGLTIAGRVFDSSGRPISDATVMVYHAGVLNGYSTFCPSCYRDCGKRTKTDAAGNYTISALDSRLWFELLVFRDGYAPAIIKIKDPSPGSAPVTTLKLRPPTLDPSHVVKGHVVDGNGQVVRDAVVTVLGLEDQQGTMYGTFPGLDPLAAANQNGDFEIVDEKPAKRMLVTVEARTLAPRFVTLVTGPKPQKIVLLRGAAVKGRLVQNGRPVGDAEIGLIAQLKGGFQQALKIVGDPYPEMRIGTQSDGTFVISDVPEGVRWFVYPKMESVARRGASGAKTCSTTKPGEIVDVGDIQLGPGYRLRGKVTLSDTQPIPDGMRVILSSKSTMDSQITLLDKNGRFTFVGLAKGEYWISPAVRGYSLPNSEPILTSVEQDRDDFDISLSPEQPTR